MRAELLAVMASTVVAQTCLAAPGDVPQESAASAMGRFLKTYAQWHEERKAQTARPHQARFIGNFTFAEQPCMMGFDQSAYSASCVCPPGNRNLQCLRSASVTIHPDPVDHGGAGYLMFTASDGGAQSVYINSGEGWTHQTKFRVGKVSAMIPTLGASHTIPIPLPPNMAAQCPSGNGVVGEEASAKTWTFMVGYGAVMPMDIELTARMQARSRELKMDYDPDKVLWSTARQNGYAANPKKGDVIGVVSCRAVSGPSLGFSGGS